MNRIGTSSMKLPQRLNGLARTPLVQQFIKALPIGRERALKAQALCAALGVPYIAGTGAKTHNNGAARIIRDLALIATAQGICVAGDNAGYYIPKSREELNETLLRQERSAKTKLARIQQLRQSAERMFGSQEEGA